MGLSVAIISPWGKNVRCGIRTYTEKLVDALAKLGADVYVTRYPRFGIRTPELLQSMVLDKIPVSQIDLVHCFPATTNILTSSGVKSIASTQVGDFVFTYDGTLGKVTRTFTRQYVGHLVKLRAQYSSEITVTPEHPFLAVKCNWKNRHIERFFRDSRYNGRYKSRKLAWVPAKDLEPGDFVALPRINDTYDIDLLSLDLENLKHQFYGQTRHFVWSHRKKSRLIPNRVRVTPDFCRLLGYYISEGSCDFRQLRFSFNVKEKEYIGDVEHLMKDIFNLEPSIYEQGEAICLTFSFKPVATLFGELCGVGARNKKLPPWALTLPKNKQKELIKGIWFGDGSLVRDGFCLATYSETLREQLRLLLVRMGIPVGVYSRYGVVKVCGSGIKVMEEILEVKHPWKSKWNFRDFAHFDDKFVYFRIRSKTEVPFVGEVYNLEVLPNNSYVISGYTVHNCQHEYGLFYPNLDAPFFAGLKLLKKPIVTTMHAVGMSHVDKLVADMSDMVIVHNEFCFRHFQGKGKVAVIPHGCDPKTPLPKEQCKKALGIDPRIPIVGYQGFIAPQKGVETLIEAMAMVPNAALLIGGGWHVETETDYIMRLKQWSLEALKGRCQWLGYVPDEMLATVYGSIDVFVYPSVYASESGALLTALSHGKAVIASDVPPFREKEGAVAIFKDVEDLAEKIKWLLADEEARRKLEESALEYAKRNSWSAVAEKHLTLYKRILEVAKANG